MFENTELRISNLSKTYPNGMQALKEVNLEIKQGMFGLLGPNGAGKSTLMRIIGTLQDSDNGTITFAGIDVLNQKHKVRENLGFLPQEFDLYPKETAYKMLDHFALLKGIINRKERALTVKSLLQKTNLWDVRNNKLGGFSGGMKQRFGIAQALLGDPKILIVDEPTAGLDPEERNRFHNLLSELGENIIVILSTHIVDDVSDLCTDMAIIDHGKVLLKGNPITEIEKFTGKTWRTLIEKNQLEEYSDRYNVISNQLFAGKRHIHVYSEEKPGNEFEPIKPCLEDIYFHTIGMHQTTN